MKNRLALLRHEKGLTLKQLGAAIGLKDNTLSQYEKDKREPKLETWKKLADYFGVSVGYIQGVSDNRNEFSSKIIADMMKDDMQQFNNNYKKKFANLELTDNEKAQYSRILDVLNSMYFLLLYKNKSTEKRSEIFNVLDKIEFLLNEISINGTGSNPDFKLLADKIEKFSKSLNQQ